MARSLPPNRSVLPAGPCQDLADSGSPRPPCRAFVPISPAARARALAAGFALAFSFSVAPAARAIPLEPGWPVTTGFSVSQSGTAAQLDADPEMEIAIASQDGYAYVYNHDGSILPGWPRYMGTALGPDQWVNQCSSPAVADLDGDGDNEVIVGNFDGRMYVFRRDGTLYPGWPFQAGWMIFSTPAVGDLDGGGPEVVFGANDGRIYALHANGTMCAGFPVVTPHVVRSSPALGDLDGDGLDEVVITADNSDYQLYALDGNGAALPGFPKVLWSSGSNSSPSLADLDGDGLLEIVAGARDGSLHVLRRDGSYLPGWPLDAGYSLQSSPTLVNLDADPELEIIVGLNDSKVSVYNLDGTLLPGWPQATTYTVVSSASVADLDADGELEIAIGENTGKVYGWNVDGTVVPGFPLLDATYTIYSSPLLADLDLDGSLELLVGCNDTRIYCWDLGPGTYNPDLLPWPEWRLHRDKDAAFVPVDPAGVEGGEAGAGPEWAALSVSVRPNPFRSGGTIAYRLPAGGPATLEVFDVRGRLVRRLYHGAAGVGEHALTWDGRGDAGRRIASGSYVVRLITPDLRAGRRIVLLE